MNSVFSWQNTNGVNFYNILTQEPKDKLSTSTENFICEISYQVIAIIGQIYIWLTEPGCTFIFPALLAHRHIKPLYRQSLSELMNGPVRKKLGIIPQNVTWGGTMSQLLTLPQFPDSLETSAAIYNRDPIFCCPLFSLSVFVKARQRRCSVTWQETS